MPTYDFTVRATDNKGAFADRAFSITVRNTKIERFVAVTDRNGYTSEDGITWTYRQGLGGRAVAYGGGSWIITQSDDTYLWSNDGIVWEPRAFPVRLMRSGGGNAYSANNVMEPCYANNQWVIITSDGHLRASTDGTNWTILKSGFTGTNERFTRIAYGQNTYVAVRIGEWDNGYASYDTGGRAVYNTGVGLDSVSNALSTVKFPTGCNMRDIFFVNDVWLATDSYNRYIYYSYNITNWQRAVVDYPFTSISGNYDMYDSGGNRPRYLYPNKVAYGNGILLLSSGAENGGIGTDYVWRSTDGGRNWNRIKSLVSYGKVAWDCTTNRIANHIAFGAGRFVCCGGRPYNTGGYFPIAYSDDGITWTNVTGLTEEGSGNEIFRGIASRLD